jgi:hypothetical protein
MAAGRVAGLPLLRSAGGNARGVPEMKKPATVRAGGQLIKNKAA